MTPAGRKRGRIDAARKRGATSAQVRTGANATDAANAADRLTPLDVMLATMRWAHLAAEAACAQVAELRGKDAIAAGKIATELRSLARGAAKDAAPYMHKRLEALKRDREAGVAHEDALAALADAMRENDARGAASGSAGQNQQPPRSQDLGPSQQRGSSKG
jgi:hypothetical protein